MVTNQKRRQRACRGINDNIEFIFGFICLDRYRLEEVVSTEADEVEDGYLSPWTSVLFRKRCKYTNFF